MCAFWKPAAVISALATRKRDLVHGISTRMCRLTCIRREHELASVSNATDIPCRSCYWGSKLLPL